MLRLFSFLMIVPILLCAKVDCCDNLFDGAKSVEVYRDGVVIEMNEQEMNKFEDIFCEALEGARQTPAYGVALDELTKEAMKSGVWCKFEFESTHIRSQMPFDELVINIEEGMQGVNVIRGNDGIYQGRCYYLELEGNLDKLYDYIVSLTDEGLETAVELESQGVAEVEIVSEEGENEDNGEDNENGDENQKDNIVISNQNDEGKEEKTKEVGAFYEGRKKDREGNKDVKKDFADINGGDKDRDKNGKTDEKISDKINERTDKGDDEIKVDEEFEEIKMPDDKNGVINFDLEEESGKSQKELLNHLT